VIDTFQAVMRALFLRLLDCMGMLPCVYCRVLLAPVPFTICLAWNRTSRPMETL